MRLALSTFLAVVTVYLFGGAAVAAETRPPNVILIVVDDLGQRDLGCYGSKFYRTPHIDDLATRGAKFSDAYAACQVCSPTRAAIMTGKYPARLHITDWLPGRGDNAQQKLLRPNIEQQLPLAEITLAEHLKAAGYATAHLGKWHLGGEGFGPREQGFDVNIGGDHTGQPRSYFAPFKDMPGLEKAPAGEYLTDRLAAEAEKFIDANQARPFLLYLPHYGVHTPLRAKPETIDKYPSQMKPGEQSNATYAAMIESVDDSIGRIVKKLADLKLSDHTIIIFTSDNGGLCIGEGPLTPATINSPLREGKGYFYEGGLRVPLLVTWPNKIKPQQSDVPVASYDLLPTILELTGCQPAKKLDGVSFASLLQGGAKPSREALYWHYPHYWYPGVRPGSAIRVGDYKLIEYYDSGRRELFNVKADLSESRNLVEEKRELAEQLAKQLDDWRKSVGAQMMTPNPNYAPNAPNKAGQIVMHSRFADIHGTTLRFEPLPHKNTLGYWVRQEDWASFDFTATKPGEYTLSILQGCGKGSGGAEVAFTVGDQRLTTIVEDTGHFQNFKRRDIGRLNLPAAGRYVLEVKPQTKPGVAVMDLREITLTPVEPN